MSGINDAQDFKIVRDALRVMEIEDEEQEALFLLVAVVIHLGNIEFSSAEGGRASLQNPVLVSTIAKVCLHVLRVPATENQFFLEMFKKKVGADKFLFTNF